MSAFIGGRNHVLGFNPHGFPRVSRAPFRNTLHRVAVHAPLVSDAVERKADCVTAQAAAFNSHRQPARRVIAEHELQVLLERLEGRESFGLHAPPHEFESGEGTVPLVEVHHAGHDAERVECPQLEPVERERVVGDQLGPIVAHGLIVSGGGVISGGAWEELRIVAEMLDAPVIQSANGKGAISDRHPLALPLRAMAEVGDDTDVVLLVGTRFVQGLMSQVLQPWVSGKTLIHMDIDPSVIGSTYPTAVGIVADAQRGLAALAEAIAKHNQKRPSRRDELADLVRYLSELGR